VAEFWRQCNEVLGTAVPHYLAPCWFTFDPVSLLITSHYDPVIPEISAEFLGHEYRDDDVLKMSSVARSASGVATIHEATGGDPDRLAPLLMAAYELTEREKDVTRLVLQGETTSSAAVALFISPQTVQQHLKNIFDKTGVRGRRELVGKMFFAHYEPRVRDNEQRAQAGRPFHGGPALPGSAGPG
jgi:DNA-binding CsgD family transcriptional regulator